MADFDETLARQLIQQSHSRCPKDVASYDVPALVGRYRKTLYAVVSSGRDIKQDYTLADRAAIAWGAVVESFSGVPGGANYKGSHQHAQDAVECRILTDRIKNYRKEFEEKLHGAEVMQQYCRDRLSGYSLRAAWNKEEAIENNTAATHLQAYKKILDERIKTESPKLKAPDAAAAVQAAKQITRWQHEIKEGSASINDYLIRMKEKTRITKVYIVLHASMDQRYVRVAEMCSLLRQKGRHLESLLDEWQSGTSSAHVVLLRQKVEECDFALKRVAELNKEYEQIETESASITTMPDTALDDAYTKAVSALAQREASRDKKSEDEGKDALDVALK